MPRHTRKYEKQLEKNIIKYSWYKIFTKRVYLPLITIQLVNVGQVTVEQLAIIVIISSIVQGVMQIPAGYVADKIGNKKALILGASIAVTSPLFYAFMPNFWGGLIASLLFFGGYAFQSGAIEAFIHDTLTALDRKNDYSKVMGRAQTYGLIGNIILVALVPLTYTINNTLPFIIGFFSLVAMLWLVMSFVYPEGPETHKTKKNPILAIQNVVTLENVALFIFCGFLTGISNKGGEFRELVFQDIGIAVGWFGIILALSSLVGAVMGWYIHILDRLKASTFYLLDLFIIAFSIAAIGLTAEPLITVAAFTIFAGYTRVRMIIFQAKMLNEVKHTYKATLISALNFFTLFADIIAILLVTRFVTLYSFQTGYVTFGLAILAIGLVLWSFILLERKRRLA